MKGGLLVLSVVLVGQLAQAGYSCTTPTPEVDAGGAIYLDFDICLEICGPASAVPVIYQESNGIAGLQRQDNIHDDTAAGYCYPSDTWVRRPAL